MTPPSRAGEKEGFHRAWEHKVCVADPGWQKLGAALELKDTGVVLLGL